MWAKIRKLLSPKNCVFGCIIVGLLLIINFMKSGTLHFNEGKSYNVTRPIVMYNNIPKYRCSNKLEKVKIFPHKQSHYKFSGNLQTRQLALVFLKDGYSKLGRNIVVLLESARFKFHTQFGTIKGLPALMDKTKGRYAAVIFEDADMYFAMSSKHRATLDKYCTDYKVGVVMFIAASAKQDKIPRQPAINKQLGDFPIRYTTHVAVKHYRINENSPILRITRPGFLSDHQVDDFTVFYTNHSLYSPLIVAKYADSDNFAAHSNLRKRKKRSLAHVKSDKAVVPDLKHIQSDGRQSDGFQLLDGDAVVAYYDYGSYDDIHRVLFGADLNFWLHKPLMLDVLGYLSHCKLELSLDRFMQIDIDDMFVGALGTRMTYADVQALVAFQEEMRTKVPGFAVQLGFSGKFYKRGNEEELKGDELFLKLQDTFQWFPHMWSHMQAHLFNDEKNLCEYMEPNKQFAIRHKFDTSSQYAVAPHHSGVFPVHEQLYNCWRNVWDIRVTSTEEYPHLRPDHMRRGFIYKDIMVLPRTICGLFTHTIMMDKYPGGPQVLNQSIEGGTLFESFLYHKFNIFMTHLSNYGNDRLGLYTFRKAIDFIQCWTNLKLQQIEPLKMAESYFELYPNEKEPIWLNPCLDKRHKEIWSELKLPSCDKFPEFVIVGPQKTGTTALHSFLLMHPDVETSIPSPVSFEEIQFFNSDNYMKGIEWYLDFFPTPTHEDEILFEKSANYFDQLQVPQRLNALLPKAKVVVLLIDPADRAYSWYQHSRAHNDQTAISLKFIDVIRSSKNVTSPAVISLRDRCLDPGVYAKHIERWLEFVPSSQFIVEDGSLLKTNPVAVLRRLQEKLNLKTKFDYSTHLKYNEKKGFFCRVSDGGNIKCLGKGKGRKYPEMSQESQDFLNNYYKESNTKLLQLLRSLKQSIPVWLDQSSIT